MLPSSSSARSRTRFTVESAVSAEEKKAERPTSNISTTSCMTAELSKINHSFFVILLEII